MGFVRPGPREERSIGAVKGGERLFFLVLILLFIKLNSFNAMTLTGCASIDVSTDVMGIQSNPNLSCSVVARVRNKSSIGILTSGGR